jgi:hypothetical protein
LKNRFPSLVLQASGGKGNLQSFSKVAAEVLDRTLWGVRFYMLADRDAAPRSLSADDSKNLRVLSRYHLENYFLDADVLSKCFVSMEANESWLRSSEQIEECLRGIARDQLGYAAALIEAKRLRDAVGNADLMPKGAHAMTRDQLVAAFVGGSETELTRICGSLVREDVAASVGDTYDELAALLDSPQPAWKEHFPGKPLLAKFASKASIPEGRLKNLYLLHSESVEKNPFAEIIEIFKGFDEHQ